MTVLTSQVLGCHDGRALGLQVAAVASERVGAVQLHSLLLSGKFSLDCCGPGRKKPCIFEFWLLLLARPHKVSCTWQQQVPGLKAFLASLSRPAQLEHCNTSSLFLFGEFSQHLMFGKPARYFCCVTC